MRVNRAFRNVGAQEAAAEGLSMEIKRLGTLLSSESFGKLINDLNRRLYEMIHGSDAAGRQAAVIAIGISSEASHHG